MISGDGARNLIDGASLIDVDAVVVSSVLLNANTEARMGLWVRGCFILSRWRG